MTNIILEGPDGGGKTTLAEHLVSGLGASWRVHHSGGPPKHEGELTERVARLSPMTCTVFDRFPTVSDPIYSAVTGRVCPLTEATIDDYYRRRTAFFIYCRVPRGSRAPADRRLRADGTSGSDEHNNLVENNYRLLLEHYDDWALERAHLIYRIGDNLNRVLRIVRSALRYS